MTCFATQQTVRILRCLLLLDLKSLCINIEAVAKENLVL